MLRKLFPLLLALLGLGAGVGAGLYLRPDKDAAVEVNPCGPAGDVEGQDAESSDEASAFNTARFVWKRSDSPTSDRISDGPAIRPPQNGA